LRFKPAVYEKLLFPLHRQAYRQIQDILDEFDRKRPGQLQRILDGFGKAAFSDTQTSTRMPGKADETFYPTLDIFILFPNKTDQKISSLRKSTDYKISFSSGEKKPSQFTGSHLILIFFQNSSPKTYIIPLEYLLGFNEQAVLREGSYQLYSHTILSPEKGDEINKNFINSGNGNIDGIYSAQKFYQKNSLAYIGITKRTWQERYRQHCRDAGRGSNLLFHRALRGEFCKIGTIEHIVERAGLTEKQALEIEESEVEKRSLHSLFPNGLNMIPGGLAGLKCVHSYAGRTGYVMKEKLTADNIEALLVEVQKHALNKNFHSTDMNRINAEIARLWAEDINFRVKATTGQRNRFSFKQIQSARVWHACGWSNVKILDSLRKIDAKEIGMDQLEKLLRGETYKSIPDVLI
jgi:hypothetical protein